MSFYPHSNSKIDHSSSAGSSFRPPPATIDLLSLVNENCSIKIIPPVDEVVSGDIVFSSALDANTKQWLDNLQHSWNLWKKSANIVNLLHRFFESVDNPFLSSLKLLLNYRGRTDCKNNTLSYVTIEELKNWSSLRFPQLSDLISLDIKIAAFNIAKEKNNVSFIKIVAEAYRISEDDIKCYVDENIRQKEYNIACQVIIAFNLKIENVIDDLLFPLILHNRTSMIDDYLATFPDEALIVVEFLDSFLGGNNFKDQIYNYLSSKKITANEIKWDRINHKSFGKIISRLCNKHHISLSICRNLTNQRAVGGLRYLIHQRYNNSISDNAWNDMVVDTIKEKPELIKELITLVDRYNTKDACKWAKFFNYSEDLCPDNMRLYMQLYMNEDNEEEKLTTPSTSQSVKYHTIPSSMNVVLIDEPEEFVRAVCEVISNELIIGIDSEWKPSFGTKKSTVSLIQISTKSIIYLIDALKLNDDKYNHLWGLLSRKVFENPNIIKLGFGIENDMHEIKSSISELKLLKYKDFNFIELQTLWKALSHAGIKLPHKKENSGEGLSAIVQQCFGTLLKKHEQCSNWEIRPLRQSQIEYAALDAHVLLQIYDLFEALCQKENLNVEDLCNRVRENAEKARMKKYKRKNNEKYINSNKGPNNTPVTPENTKLLVETCLGVVAKYLRCCGIDVEIINQSDSWQSCIERANNEKRFIVIKYINSKKVSKVIPRNHVYVLESHLMEEQFKEIFTYFNVSIQKNSLFSRCDNCNHTDITVISQSVMRKLKSPPTQSDFSKSATPSLQVRKQQQCTYANSDEDDDEFDDYGQFLSDKEEEFDELVLVAKDLVLSSEKIDVDQRVTRFRVSIQLDNITNEIMNHNREFHVCQTCGKCFYQVDFFPENLYNVIVYMMPSSSISTE